ncbi:BTB domain-containing protein [Mycena sanguinolenta]|uniref:BTB domain-containing protein n=1 Tax=Mycena sanguinolenta TaxID=230812 RepID=A0A8H6Y282_9AGAR|nr:BTB domain-containing protein [Mycena sanguinolenta]
MINNPVDLRSCHHPENVSITRSKIWRPDGNVVLQAENTQFHVHWIVLALSSTFFEDMQGLPQPPDQPAVEGCPIVPLPDSSAVDVEHLWTVLYDPTFMSEPALPLAVVGALIRLGRKYNFKKLLDAAVAR